MKTVFSHKLLFVNTFQDTSLKISALLAAVQGSGGWAGQEWWTDPPTNLIYRQHNKSIELWRAEIFCATNSLHIICFHLIVTN